MTRAPKIMPSLFAVTYASLPFFPSFITLTAVTVPGVSLLPPQLAWSLLGLMAIIAIVATALILRPPRVLPPTFVPLVAWMCCGVVAAIFGLNPRAGSLFIAIFALGIVWHVGVWKFYDDVRVRAAIYWSYLLSGLIAAAAAILMVITRHPASQYTIGHRRAIGTFILPGELAGYLIVYLPLALALAWTSDSKALRRVAWSGCIVGAIAFAMTFSRAGWIGFAAAAAFYVALTRSRNSVRYALIPAIVGLLVVLFAFDMNHNPSENFTRLSIWQGAIAIVQRFPLTGVGPFNFATAYALVRLPDGEPTAFHAHSFLLTTFAEMGIVGVLAVLWMWWRFAVALRDLLRTASPVAARVALAVAAGLVGTLVQGVIDTVSVVIFGLWLPTMALALAIARDGVSVRE